MRNGMVEITKNLTIPLKDLTFRTSRSSGPGGQHVNKAETRVELLFDVSNSTVLSEQQRGRLLKKLAGMIDSLGVLHVVAQDSRSQSQNKEIAIDRFVEILRRALKPKKKRIQTKPTRSSKEERLSGKKKLSDKKRLRSKMNDD